MNSKQSIIEVRRHSLLSAILISIVLSGVYVAYLTLAPQSPFEQIFTPSLCGGWLYEMQQRYHVWCGVALFLGVAYLSLRLGQTTSRFDLYGVTTHISMELYPLLLMGVMVNLYSLRILAVSILILYSIRRFFSAYKSANRSDKLSSGTMALGVAVLIYPPSITLWIVVPFMLILFDRTLREVIVSFVTLLIPPFAYLYIKWLAGDNIADVWQEFTSKLLTHNGFTILDSFSEVTVAILILILYLSINSILAISILENTARAKQRLKLIAVYAISIALMVAVPSSDSSVFGLLAIPVAILIPITLLKVSRVLSFILYIALLLTSALSMIWF